jgi:hypothetical protein
MVVINFIHWLVGPVVRWHRAYEAKIVCHYLLEHDRDVQRAIELFREERKVGPSKRKLHRRRVLRLLRTIVPDDAVRTIIHKKFPPAKS